MDRGKLVARLRSERGITQQGLAQLLGKATSTIVRVEHNNGTWPSSTARQVFEILQNSLPIEQKDAFEFLDAFGVSRTLYVAAPLPPSAQAPRGESTEAASVQEALQLLSKCFERFGTAGTANKLRDLLGEDDEDEDRRVLITPPRPSKTVPGAIEQQFVGYSKPKSAAAIKRATKATRPA